MASTQFNERFEVPEAALAVVDQIVNGQEILLIESLEQDFFTAAEARQALQTGTGDLWMMDRVNALLTSAYQRGVIQLADETQTRYKIGSFYTRLDIFAISEPDSYLALPREIRIALDQWYFESYLNRLAPGSPAPTADQVVTLRQAKDYLDSISGQIWLNRCDCRTLAGNCDLATDVCISFRSGINTFSHRGWSTPVTKEQAKKVLERADQAGLIHTVNPGGICNCCGDCCYLFRAQRARQSNPVWPAAPSIAAFHPESCADCGLCIERCHFEAFERKDGTIQYHPDLCRGCGLCSETCPAGAIDIVERGN
jgi:MinD superfamily P-loop ATPase containing an inserted ferredoxin domain